MRVRGCHHPTGCVNSWTGFQFGASGECQGAGVWLVSWQGNTYASGNINIWFALNGGAFQFSDSFPGDSLSATIGTGGAGGDTVEFRVDIGDSCGNIVDSSSSGELGACP